jgi:hypothetical protein
MPVNLRLKAFVCVVFALVTFFASTGTTRAGEYLVGDRTLGRVLRYSETGTFIATLLYDPSLGSGTGTSDGGITGITLSPDQTKLFVSDRLSNRVAVYSYNGSSASHLYDITALTSYPSTLYVPAGVLFSQDASKIYVANLGPFDSFQLPAGNTVGQIVAATGTSAGPDLTGGPANGRAGLAYSPNGDILASMFGFSTGGGVLRYDSGAGQFVDFITPRSELRGAANLLVVGNDLYVAAGYGGRVGKFSALTGTLDTSFGTNGYIGPDANFAFPASLALGAGGNSILVGVLGATTGDSRIDQYSFNGTPVGSGPWANNATSSNYPNGTNNPPGNNIQGFTEPTAIVHSTVPEPSTAILALLAALAMRVIAPRRRR